MWMLPRELHHLMFFIEQKIHVDITSITKHEREIEKQKKKSPVEHEHAEVDAKHFKPKVLKS